MMKTAIGLLVLAGFGLMACAAQAPARSADGDDTDKEDNSDTPSSTPSSTTPTSTTPTAVAGACPTTVPTAVQVATATDATDVQVAGNHVFFRATNNTLNVTNFDGTGAHPISSGDPNFPNSRFWVTPDAILQVGSGANGQARLTRMTIDANGTPTAQSFGIVVNGMSNSVVVPFGFANGQYLLMDASAGTQGSLVFSVDTAGNAQEVAFQSSVAYTDPSASSQGVFFVTGGATVMKASPTAEAGTPVGTLAGCRLAAGLTNVFCATPTNVFAFDASNIQRPIFDVNTSVNSKAPLGQAIADGDVVFVGSSTPAADTTKNVIREIRSAGVGAPGTERLMACGRETITSMGVDATHIAFSEANKGVWVAPR